MNTLAAFPLPAANRRASTARFVDYQSRLSAVMRAQDWTAAARLADELLDCAVTGRRVFLIGNGGSAGNAIHLANDFMYAWSKARGRGIRVQALAANAAVLTCLANDEGYDQIFAAQLAIEAEAGDVLIAFSGSGNSPNILRALAEARRMGLRSYGVLGFDGGRAKPLCDTAVHFETGDMQIAEDLQLILGHMIVQHLHAHRHLAGPA